MGAESFIDFALQRLPQLGLRTGEHLMLTGVSTGVAVILGVPMGILASRISYLRSPLLGITGILQTVPSLAMLAILLALTGKIGAVPAIIALILYALLPIVRNAVAGIEGVSTATLEAARGIGMTDYQQLSMVKIPLALPVMVAGIRTAAVTGVGIATLSAFIGAGGLGQFINRGLALSSNNLVLLGAIPAAILALIVDFSIGAMVWSLQSRRQRHFRPKTRLALKTLSFSLPLLVGLGGAAAYMSGGTWGRAPVRASEARDHVPQVTVVIGSKNFTEQLILGELMAQLIEARTDLSVARRFNLGGTMICHGALVNGEIDLYAEYTGTGLTAVLHRGVLSDPEEVFLRVKEAYRSHFKVTWLPPFGFNNTYAMTVREGEARKRGWESISDLIEPAPGLRAGFTAEFAERPDGYPGLQRVYGLSFGEVRDFDPTLMVEALVKDEVDVICAFATDGRLSAYHLRALEDDRAFFPPYYAAPVVRNEVLDAHPQIQHALAPLSGLLSNVRMQRLNYQVDGKKRSPKEVARDFLKSHKLLKKP